MPTEILFCCEWCYPRQAGPEAVAACNLDLTQPQTTSVNVPCFKRSMQQHMLCQRRLKLQLLEWAASVLCAHPETRLKDCCMLKGFYHENEASDIFST